MTQKLPPIIRSLISPGVLTGPSGSIKLLQTQMSWVILTDEHALKIKKPVNLGYLDYSTLEKRRYFCFKELELNRRLCPGVYLEVVTITGTGENFDINGDGEVAEYAVRMVRLPEDRMLDEMLVRDEVTPEKMGLVASKIADFHQQTETSDYINSFGSLDCIKRNASENFEQTSKYAGDIVSIEAYEHIKRFTLGFIKDYSSIFKNRIKNYRIRDCHGDLHSSHICFTNGICVYDCIEFNDRFRYSDTASEVAFLAMDLDHYGRADLAMVFIKCYIKASGDQDIEKIIKFYKCYRAMVRAKVNCFKTEDPYLNPDERGEARRKAEVYFDLSRAYTLDNPVLLVNVGLVGSGKTTMSKELAGRMGMVVISSDVVRKSLAGIHPSETRPSEIDSGIYSPHFSKLTYNTMFKQAKTWLERGVSVILDATFTHSESRQSARNIARTCNANFGLLEYRIDDEEACARLKKRMHQPENISDAGPEIYFRMKNAFQPLDETESRQRVIIDTRLPVKENINRVQKYVYSM